MQHRQDFHELMIATPEFAIDMAVKGFQQSLWCRTCSDYVVFEQHESPSTMRTKCDEVWDWIDYGKHEIGRILRACFVMKRAHAQS
jgi:hypothetical protein